MRPHKIFDVRCERTGGDKGHGYYLLRRLAATFILLQPRFVPTVFTIENVGENENVRAFFWGGENVRVVFAENVCADPYVFPAISVNLRIPYDIYLLPGWVMPQQSIAETQ